MVAAAGQSALEPGTLPANWITGGPNCVSVPDWQVHEYNEDFYILRESGCTHYEKPFLYLIFGRDKALLEDTGAGKVDTAPFVMDLVAKWAKRKNRERCSSNGDSLARPRRSHRRRRAVSKTADRRVRRRHSGGDSERRRASPRGPPTSAASISAGRIIDVIPIPGHNDASIALYDRTTGNLLTGDSLYPGRLYVAEAELPAYAASAQRLVDFVETRPIAHVLGTHIEQARTPYVDYPSGTAYQPDEHALELTRAHVLELNDAFLKMTGKPEKVALPDFTIVIRRPTGSR